MRRIAAVIGVAAAVVATGGTAQAGPPRTPVVPSLQPAATAKLWRELVAHPRTHAARQGACRPLRAIFYAQTDWLRLATKLAAQPSPCAQYYVSVPPLAAAKTTLRNGEAAKIRALGPNFHALAEIHYAGWSQWVASNNATWFDAGVEARKRMEAAGFDVAKGDTWAVNELSSAVRVGTGTARQNARDLVRGLATGSGGTPVKGVAWTVGISQPVADTTLYQTNLQNWLGDAAFWTDMAAYVSDWSQEVYPDWRKTAVPGSTDAAAPRLSERLPPARARARAGGAADDRAGPQLHPERLRAARERGLVVGHGLRLVGDPVRPDAVVRLAPGLRAAGVQRLARPAAGPLGLRVGAAQRRPLVRRLQLPVGRDPRPARRGDPRLGGGLQPGRPRDRGVQRHPARATSRADRSPSSGSRSARGRSRC